MPLDSPPKIFLLTGFCVAHAKTVDLNVFVDRFFASSPSSFEKILDFHVLVSRVDSTLCGVSSDLSTVLFSTRETFNGFESW